MTPRPDLTASHRAPFRKGALPLLALLAAAGGGSESFADTLHVPAQFPTIQAAIDAARPLDEVIVADGVYTGAGNKNLDYRGKMITVRGISGDPARCTIDCQGSGRGVWFHSGETPASVLEAMTVTNGSMPDGAGVLCEFASPTIRGCCFRSNTATGANPPCASGLVVEHGGGGARSTGGSPLFVLCEFSSNSAPYGAGLLVTGGSPSLTACTFDRNTAAGFDCASGGAVLLDAGATPVFEDCGFQGNRAYLAGGAVLSNGSAGRWLGCGFTSNSAALGGAMVLGFGPGFGHLTTVSGCAFRGNRATGDVPGLSASGGAIYAEQIGRLAIHDSVFLFNSGTGALGAGGALSMVGGTDASIVNCEFRNNSTPQHGGAIRLTQGASAAVVHCTLAGNSAQATAGAASIDRGASMGVANSIAWQNAAPLGTQFAIGFPSAGPAALAVRYCDVEGGSAGCAVNPGSTLAWFVPGNIVADPMFVDGPLGNLRLGGRSPCIDAADNTAVPLGILTDLDGKPRFMDDPRTPDSGVPGGAGGSAIADMGAYELQRCSPDCDTSTGPGVLDIFDFLCFQNRYDAGDPYACDCDTGSGPGLCDIFDFLCFQNAFAAGCP